MGKKLEVPVGTKFARLTVVAELERYRQPNGKTNRIFQCVCECGNEVITKLKSLRHGESSSCGCYQKEAASKSNKTHGMSKSRPYTIWEGMISRCTKEANPSYVRYAGRGISIAEEWRDFIGFWKDMEQGYSDDLTLDRINPNGNYCKENCRWATQTTQAYNKRAIEGTSTGITGVYPYANKQFPYYAEISFENKKYALGKFSTIDAAIESRKKAEIKLYGYNKPTEDL